MVTEVRPRLPALVLLPAQTVSRSVVSLLRVPLNEAVPEFIPAYTERGGTN